MDPVSLKTVPISYEAHGEGTVALVFVLIGNGRTWTAVVSCGRKAGN